MFCSASFITKDASTECTTCLHDGDECCASKSATNETFSDEPGSTLEQIGGGMTFIAVVSIGSIIVVLLAGMMALHCRKRSAVAATPAPEPVEMGPVEMVPMAMMASADSTCDMQAIPMAASIAGDPPMFMRPTMSYNDDRAIPMAASVADDRGRDNRGGDGGGQRGTWTCDICTLVNSQRNERCESCLQGRRPQRDAAAERAIVSRCQTCGGDTERGRCTICGARVDQRGAKVTYRGPPANRYSYANDRGPPADRYDSYANGAAIGLPTRRGGRISL